MLFILNKDKFNIYFKQESVSVTFPANKYHADISKAESNISTELLIQMTKIIIFQLRLMPRFLIYVLKSVDVTRKVHDF